MQCKLKIHSRMLRLWWSGKLLTCYQTLVMVPFPGTVVLRKKNVNYPFHQKQFQKNFDKTH